MFKKYLLCSIFIFILIISNIKISQINLKDTIKTFNINIKGAVKQDIVLEVNNQMIVEDVIKMVELNDNADISKLNLSLKLYPEMIISIDERSETKLISINSASIEELITLPGIKEASALKIINYRNLNGPFLTLEDLMNVTGIGVKKYAKIKDFICL